MLYEVITIRRIRQLAKPAIVGDQAHPDDEQNGIGRPDRKLGWQHTFARDVLHVDEEPEVVV